MALYYRNRTTNRVVELLEPDELVGKLRTVRRRGKALDKDRIHVAKQHRKQLIEKMGDSWKWEKLDGKPRNFGQKSSGQPKVADVRAWAAENGIDVPDKGKIPDEVVEQYKAAQAAGDGD